MTEQINQLSQIPADPQAYLRAGLSVCGGLAQGRRGQSVSPQRMDLFTHQDQKTHKAVAPSVPLLLREDILAGWNGNGRTMVVED